MEQRVEEKNIKLQDKKKVSIIEKIGKKIPDPVIILASFIKIFSVHIHNIIIFNTFFRWKNF